MLYVELQHHKVTPCTPPPPLQPSSLQPMTHHKVCGDVTPYYQPSCSDQKCDISAHWPDSIIEGSSYYPHKKCASCLNRWFDITNPQVKPSSLIRMLNMFSSNWFVWRLPMMDQLHDFPPPALDSTSLTFVCSMWMKCIANMYKDNSAVSMPGGDIMKHAENTCFQFLTHFVVSSNQWCSLKWKGGVISRPLSAITTRQIIANKQQDDQRIMTTFV